MHLLPLVDHCSDMPLLFGERVRKVAGDTSFLDGRMQVDGYLDCIGTKSGMCCFGILGIECRQSVNAGRIGVAFGERFHGREGRQKGRCMFAEYMTDFETAMRSM